MKKNRFLIVVLSSCVACIIFLFVKCDGTNQPRTLKSSKSTNIMENHALSNIFNRKSVRNFTEEPVSKEQIELLIRAGMAAPTARNTQPWAFIAVTDRATLDNLAENLPYAKMLKQSPAAIVVCGDLEKLGDATPEYWIMDCSAATENILLAAEAIGLGAVWTAAYPQPDRVEAVVKILNIPEYIVPLCVIPVGVPTGVDQPKNKYIPENIHWEKW